MKIRFAELEQAIHTVENAALQAASDQHFEAVGGFKTAAKIMRTVPLEIEEVEPPKP